MKKLTQPAGKSPAGRPPKFGEPSRPVTVTLPDSTLRSLAKIGPDRGRAIVKLAAWAMRQEGGPKALVDIVEMTPHAALIVVGPNRSLGQIPFLHLVEVAPARYVLAMDQGNDFKTLELAVSDALDDVPEDDDVERQLLTELLRQIRSLRKSDRVSMAEILFVRLDDKRRR